MTLTSTNYPRTFQSAIAFTFGLLQASKHVSPIVNYLNASTNTHFCMNADCDCAISNSGILHHQYEIERKQYFDQIIDSTRRTSLLEAASLLNIADVHDPLAFIDVLLGRYICRRRIQLPCITNRCIHWSHLTDAVDLATLRATNMYDEIDRSMTTRRLFVVEAYPILLQVMKTIEKLRISSDKNHFELFSGHDVTITPLLYVLGLKHREPVHYASRLVFEIYNSMINVTDMYIRVLFNGHDCTDQLKFCQPNNNLCIAQDFEQFVRNGLFRLANVNKLADICNQTSII